jgi:hypothetical protein
MQRILVVANQTLGGSDLMAVMGERLAKDACDVYLLVPVQATHPVTSPSAKLASARNGRLRAWSRW